MTEQRSKQAVGLSWIDILRLGLVQAALGSIVVLTNSTLNRVMVVELGLAAVIPGLLVGIHYAVQISRPLWGHRSDAGDSRTRWVLAGIALLALSGTLAASSTFLFEINTALGLVVAAIAYMLIGIGIGASGTSLLALLATRTAPERRATAATTTWMLMIAGIIVTSIVTGILLDPYSHARLVAITAGTGAVAFLVAVIGIVGIERKPAIAPEKQADKSVDFRESLRSVWADSHARLFTVFIFVSMLAYSTQDLILEPFAGILFGMTPGETTKLSGTQHSGVFIGMAIVGLGGLLLSKRVPNLSRLFIVAGCLGSALAMALLCVSASLAPAWPLSANIFLLGFMNGMFAVAAISTMMVLANSGGTNNAGMKMGLWGAAQAIAFGLGGLTGSIGLDLGRLVTGSNPEAFSLVFGLEAVLFLASAVIAIRIGQSEKQIVARGTYLPSSAPAE